VSKDLFPDGCVRKCFDVLLNYVRLYGESVFCTSRQDSTSVVVYRIFLLCAWRPLSGHRRVYAVMHREL